MANIAKIYNENLFDFVIRGYGSMDFLSLFISENDIDDILFFNTQPAGTKFIVTPQPVTVSNNPLPVITEEAFITHKKVRNQNVFDFVLTHYGSLEHLSLFFEDNNMTNILAFGLQAVGTQFNVTEQSNRVRNTYIRNNYDVATGSNPPPGDFNDDFNNDFFN